MPEDDVLLWLLLACAEEKREEPCVAARLQDADGDGWGVEATTEVCAPEPRFGDGDCDDGDAEVSPDAAENCDGRDEDCDGVVDDDPGDGLVRYADSDGDGFGAAAAATRSCEPPPGSVDDATDCDDTDADAFPGAVETCDGQDDDCDGTPDDDAVDGLPWYRDADVDGFGDASAAVSQCDAPDGYVADATDCDDADAAAAPGNAEVCGGGDEDCDGEVDEDDAEDAPSWYYDGDGDGYGFGGPGETTSCERPSTHAELEGDCDDGEAAVNPGATDTPGDRVDDDCDGTWACYADADLDGYGGSATVASVDSDCRDAGESTRVTDCDDTRDDAHPGGDEVAYDGVDQDCDGADYADLDGDGHDATAAGGADCDDDDVTVSPDAAERCDYADIDDDCDGLVDEADPDLATTASWYADADGDGAGDAATAVVSACPPDGWVGAGDDCDDTDADVRPLAAETCDDVVDRNCDGYTGAEDHDGDGAAACEECDDGDAARVPGAVEVGDGEDDDCDGLVDEHEGDVALATEAQVDTFCATYASVEGDLDVSDMASLRGLGCLRAVSGSVRVSGVTAQDLRGLEALTDVGVDVLLGGWQDAVGGLEPSSLVSLDGLERLARVGGDVWVAESEVADLSGAARLQTVGGSLILLEIPLADATIPLVTLGDDLWLEGLPALTQVAAPSLTSLGGSLWLERLGTTSGGFTVDWTLDVPGSLALVDLPGSANAGWVLPETVGALYVEDTDLADLSGLETLREVQGDLLVSHNRLLTDLSALDALETVGGDLGVENNDALATWDGFAALTRVGGWLRLSGSGPTTVAGFDALETIGEGLNVESNADLTTLGGFGSLSSCPDLDLYYLRYLTSASGLEGVPFSGTVSVVYVSRVLDLGFLSGVTALDGSLTVKNNGWLASLSGLEGLETVAGAVDFRDDHRLADASLPALSSVGGALTLAGMPMLASIDLGVLETVGGDMALDDLHALTDLGGLAALRQVGGLLLSELDALVDLTGLGALTTVDGSLIVEENPSLAGLAGLDALVTVGEDLQIAENPVLVDVSGLGALTQVGRDLAITGNTALVRPDGLGASVSIGRDLWVEQNPALLDLSGMGEFAVANTVWLYDNASMASLTGLDHVGSIPHHLVLASLPALADLAVLANLSHIGGHLRISDCDALTSLAGLDALAEVGGNLEIGDQVGWSIASGGSDALTSLDGLGALTTVTGTLWIEGNPVLADIAALDGLTSIGSDLGVKDNVSLPTADAMGLADGTPAVGGTVTVSGNL